MSKFHKSAKLTLLVTLSAIALLSITGVAFADTSSAPGQQWTVGTRVYNGHGDLVFHTTHATSTSSILAQFDVPSSTYGFSDYLYDTSAKSLPSGGSITATITIDAATGTTFEAGPWTSAAGASAMVHLFFQSNTPVSDMASCMPPGYGANNYWWSTDSYTITGSASGVTLTATLDSASWTGICGQHATDAQFAQALSSVTEVGFAFGSPSAYAAGMATTSGSATFEVTSYTIATT